MVVSLVDNKGIPVFPTLHVAIKGMPEKPNHLTTAVYGVNLLYAIFGENVKLQE